VYRHRYGLADGAMCLSQEKKLMMDIKKSAKAGQMVSTANLSIPNMPYIR
jgi:hypothetical protein